MAQRYLHGLKSVVSNHTAFGVNPVIAITGKSVLSNHSVVNSKSITMAQSYRHGLKNVESNHIAFGVNRVIATTGKSVLSNHIVVNPKSITMAQRYRYEISMAKSGGCIHRKSITMAMAKAGGCIGGRGYITMAGGCRCCSGLSNFILFMLEFFMIISMYPKMMLRRWENTAPRQQLCYNDFIGVPSVVDLASMHDAMKELGSDPDKINPLAGS
ncbi:hypothetical protein MTR67_033413 [Solanum verrucosum]|uniref:Uncharacterized protein n=1 Tax=Solanum verrucosum TaxID=315347 RepID=A0AAF0U5Z4_SOLVR|nr:hypothetical protein MTR67_033413 [Solanum verrucosum]